MRERVLHSEWDLITWDPIEDGAMYGNHQWWFARYQGRFYNFFLYAN